MAFNFLSQPLLVLAGKNFNLNQFLLLYLVGAAILFFIGAGIGLFISVRYFKEEKDTPWKYFFPAIIGGAGGLFLSPLVIFLGFVIF